MSLKDHKININIVKKSQKLEKCSLKEIFSEG